MGPLRTTRCVHLTPENNQIFNCKYTALDRVKDSEKDKHTNRKVICCCQINRQTRHIQSEKDRMQARYTQRTVLQSGILSTLISETNVSVLFIFLFVQGFSLFLYLDCVFVYFGIVYTFVQDTFKAFGLNFQANPMQFV